MHPLDSLAEVRLAELHHHRSVDLRVADQRRAAASLSARLRSAIQPRPVVPPAACGGAARRAGPA